MTDTLATSTVRWDAIGTRLSLIELAGARPKNLGIFSGVADLATYIAWLGRTPEFLLINQGNANSSDWLGSLGYWRGQYSSFPGIFIHSLQPIYSGQTLAAAAAGTYNTQYATLASGLISALSGTDPIYCRLPQEFNGNWFPWSVGTYITAADYVNICQNIVTSMRSVTGGSRFKFEWCPNIGQSVDLAACYPGDSYIDIIGMDFYYQSSLNAHAGYQWTAFVNQTYGLQWHADFAATHGKLMAYSEWGVETSNGGEYIAEAAKWFASQPVIYHNYWNSNAGFPGLIGDGGKGITSDTYRLAFS